MQYAATFTPVHHVRPLMFYLHLTLSCQLVSFKSTFVLLSYPSAQEQFLSGRCNLEICLCNLLSS